ncbi:uncharacterized protein LOC142326643 isoform X1 [Lycorma delicatula]|uniref:uncharacterized protein LOC142326643 isoform X1 n=1 Tax=Lycorma delicatula TaxID=130591 RepID=UPI003F50F834
MLNMAEDNVCCVWIGNLHEKVNEELIYELFLQAGPVKNVNLPKNPNGRLRSYGFVTFKHECSAGYAKELFKDTKLFGKEILIKPRKDYSETNEVPFGVNALRGFNSDIGHKGRNDVHSPSSKFIDISLQMKGRNDLHSPSSKFIDLSLQVKPGCPAANGPVGMPQYFDMLLKMGDQLQSPAGSSMIMESPSIFGSPLMYPSQKLDPIMDRHEEHSKSHGHNDRSYNHRNRDWGHDRDRDHLHYDKSHPYRDHRREFRHAGYNSQNYSSNSHRRGRK